LISTLFQFFEKRIEKRISETLRIWVAPSFSRVVGLMKKREKDTISASSSLQFQSEVLLVNC
jgi:hypothetical protein